MVASKVSCTVPPINEVVIGRYFLSRSDFLVPHFGSFWDRLRGEYPSVQHAPPLMESAGEAVEFILPRVWYVSADSARLVQLQQDRMFFNWRERGSGAPYPRFPAIQAAFLSAWAQFEDVVHGTSLTPIVPRRAELKYINIFGEGVASSLAERLRRSMRGVSWIAPQGFAPELAGYRTNLHFTLPGSNNVLHVDLASARKKADNADALRLELTVQGDCGPDSSFKEWSQEAHDQLVVAFADLTSEEMHERWQLTRT